MKMYIYSSITRKNLEVQRLKLTTNSAIGIYLTIIQDCILARILFRDYTIYICSPELKWSQLLLTVRCSQWWTKLKKLSISTNVITFCLKFTKCQILCDKYRNNLLLVTSYPLIVQ